jgi:dynein heavy chain
LIWGIGGCIEETTRGKFDAFFKQLLNGEDVMTEHTLDLGEEKNSTYEPMKIDVKMGDAQTIFDVYYDMEEARWIPWTTTVPKYEINKDDTYLDLSIPTIDSIRMKNLAITLLQNNKHIMFVGPTGTGKSVQINSMLKENFDNQKWANFVLGFSAQTTANQTERIIDLQMEKRRKGVYGPNLGKEGVIFVDDLSMPQKGTYGA